MVWAFSTQTSIVIQHNGRGSFDLFIDNNGNIYYGKDTTTGSEWDYRLMVEVHGWWLWVAWSVLGFV